MTGAQSAQHLRATGIKIVVKMSPYGNGACPYWQAMQHDNPFAMQQQQMHQRELERANARWLWTDGSSIAVAGILKCLVLSRVGQFRT